MAEQRANPSTLFVVVELCIFAALVGYVPKWTGDQRGHGSWLSVVAYFLIFAVGGWLIEVLPTSVRALSTTSKKPREFTNTALSLVNAFVLARLFAWAIASSFADHSVVFDIAQAPSTLSTLYLPFHVADFAAFTASIRPAIATVVPLAIGYLAADVVDMWRKDLLSTFIFIHHIGASTPAVVWLVTDGEHEPLTRAILLIVACEVNSVFLHTRRLMHILPPPTASGVRYNVVNLVFFVTLVVFRLVSSFWFLALYVWSYCTEWTVQTATDLLVGAGVALFAHHNYTLMKRAILTIIKRRKDSKANNDDDDSKKKKKKNK